MPESLLNVYINIATDRDLQKYVEDIVDSNLSVNKSFLSMHADFVISDEWQKFGADMPGIFVGHHNTRISNLSRKRNVVFMCFENRLVYTPRSLSLNIHELEGERIVAENMVGTAKHKIESMQLSEYLSEWVPPLSLKR